MSTLTSQLHHHCLWFVSVCHSDVVRVVLEHLAYPLEVESVPAGEQHATEILAAQVAQRLGVDCKDAAAWLRDAVDVLSASTTASLDYQDSSLFGQCIAENPVFSLCDQRTQLRAAAIFTVAVLLGHLRVLLDSTVLVVVVGLPQSGRSSRNSIRGSGHVAAGGPHTLLVTQASPPLSTTRGAPSKRLLVMHQLSTAPFMQTSTGYPHSPTIVKRGLWTLLDMIADCLRVAMQGSGSCGVRTRTQLVLTRWFMSCPRLAASSIPDQVVAVIRADVISQVEHNFLRALRPRLEPGVLLVVANRTDEVHAASAADFVERRILAESYLGLSLMRNLVFTCAVPMDDLRLSVTPAGTADAFDACAEVCRLLSAQGLCAYKCTGLDLAGA